MTIFNFSYAIDTLNKGTNTVTVIYFPEDGSLGSYLEIINFDPSTHNTPEALEELIISRTPTHKWITATTNAGIDLSSLDGMLGQKIEGKSKDSEPVGPPGSPNDLSLAEYKVFKKNQASINEIQANQQPMSYNGKDYPAGNADGIPSNTLLEYTLALSFTGTWPTTPLWVTTNGDYVILSKINVQSIVDLIVERGFTNRKIAIEIKNKIDLATSKVNIDNIILDNFK